MTPAEVEDDNIVHSDAYFVRMLQSMKVDEDEAAARTEADKFQTLTLLNRTKKNDEKDPTSPFTFMKSAKFQMWDRSTRDRISQRSDPETLALKQSLAETRDLKRMMLMCEREIEASNRTPKTRSKMQMILRDISHTAKSARERKLDKELLNPYRTDVDNYNRLMIRLSAIHENVRGQSVGGSRPQSARPPSARSNHQNQERNGNNEKEDCLRSPRAVKTARGQAAAVSPPPAEPPLREVTALPSPRPVSMQTGSLIDRRKKLWLVNIVALLRLNMMAQSALQTRAARNKNLKQWKAVKMIQKAWKHFRRPKNQQAPHSQRLTLKIRQSMTVVGASFATRSDAAAQIIDFLQDTVFRRAIANFLRRVRRVQWDFRGLKLITNSRILVLHRLIDTVLPTLAQHVSCVLNGRGIDLRNINFFEQTQFAHNVTNSRTPALAKAMNTHNFHAYLRNQGNKLNDIHRLYFGTAKLWSDSRYPDLRHQSILNLLLKKRSQFWLIYRNSQTAFMELPMFTVSDVQEFIKLDSDPLQKYLQDIEERLEEKRMARMNRSAFRKRTAEEIISLPRLMPLTSITPQELFEMLENYAELVDASTKAPAQMISTSAKVPDAATRETTSASDSQPRVETNQTVLQAKISQAMAAATTSANAMSAKRRQSRANAHLLSSSHQRSSSHGVASLPSSPVRSTRSPALTAQHRSVVTSSKTNEHPHN